MIFPLIFLAFFSCSEPKSVLVEEKAELTFFTQEFVKNTCIGESCASVSFTWPLAKGSEIAAKINESIDQQLRVYFYGDSVAPTLEAQAQLYLNSYEDFVN